MSLAIDPEFFAAHPAAASLLELFEVLPGIIFFAKDRQSRFVAANSTMLATKNLSSPGELLGRSDRDFHPPALAEAYIAEDANVMKAGRSLTNQSWFVMDGHGRPGWFRSSKVPIRSVEGRVIGLAGVRYAISTPEERAAQFQNLATAVQYLEANFAENVSAARLAKLAGMSVTHLNRRFAETFRMSPNKFLLSVRVERARYLLAKTTATLGEIAVEAGFYDQSHFTRHFRRLTGLTPRMYRTQFQSGQAGSKG